MESTLIQSIFAVLAELSIRKTGGSKSSISGYVNGLRGENVLVAVLMAKKMMANFPQKAFKGPPVDK
ncbi:hypothetical protein HUJ05_007124 [Dendroctonus ponderosae]|nr:hypothetical protein HUJ05_007124 [Dendroctonus ponderosae]